MKYIKLYEDLEFDPNNFRKLRKDIKHITIELKDNGFKIQPFEVENDNEFDNFDFFVKIYRGQSSMNKWGFTYDEVEEYIEMIKDYVDNYYTYSNLVVFYDGSKLVPKPNGRITQGRITQVEIEIGDIKKK
jgi:nitrogen regulatory protein PII-like uncharacterized protein